MNFFAAIPESPLDPVPAFYIEPKDSDPASEKARVVRFRRVLALVLPKARVVAVPNAGKRGYAAQAQVKAEGLATGFPDMVVLWNGEAAFLEWKAGKTMPSRQQIEWLNWLHETGYPCAVVRTSAGALAFLRKLGWPV